VWVYHWNNRPPSLLARGRAGSPLHAVDTAMQRSSARIHSTSLRAGCNTPYQIERLRSDVAITVSSKKPVTVGSAETTAPGEKPMHL
jgi:hypothetical protein